MARPKAKEPRLEQLNLSLTASELEGITRRAQAVGMRPSHFGRMALLDAKIVAAQQEEPSNENRLLLQQLIRIGVNLNQMMKYLHHTGHPAPPDLEPLLRDIRCLIERAAQ